MKFIIILFFPFFAFGQSGDISKPNGKDINVYINDYWTPYDLSCECDSKSKKLSKYKLIGRSKRIEMSGKEILQQDYDLCFYKKIRGFKIN